MAKKIVPLTLMVAFFCWLSSAQAYTVYFGFGEGIDFNAIDGFDLFVSHDCSDPLHHLTMNTYSKGTTDPNGRNGAVPPDYIPGSITAYDIYLTHYGVSALRNYYNEIPGWDTNFQPGIVISLEASNPFELQDIDLNSITPTGSYEGPWTIIETKSPDSITYIAAAPVPIPAAAWLLGAGLAGLFGFSRRNI